MHNELDQYISRLQTITPFNLHHPSEDGHDVVPWYDVTQQVAYELVIDQLNVPGQVERIAAQIQAWGRYKSIAERCLQIVERNYRRWQAAFCLKKLETEEKKPAEHVLEKMYRIDPEYGVWQRKIEMMTEALNASNAIYEAFRTKAQMLAAYAHYYRELATRR